MDQFKFEIEKAKRSAHKFLDSVAEYEETPENEEVELKLIVMGTIHYLGFKDFIQTAIDREEKKKEEHHH